MFFECKTAENMQGVNKNLHIFGCLILFLIVLKLMLILHTLLIGAECARLLRDYGAGETPQAQSAEEAPRNARGKRSTWSGNQQTSLT